jgi:hypothetical protein
VIGAILALLVSGVFLFNVLLAQDLYPFDYQAARYLDDVIDGKLPQDRPNEVVIIGDSTASRALLPRHIEEFNAVSLAINGGNLRDSYYALKRYLQSQPSPRCIAIMTSYGAYQFHNANRFWAFTVAAGFLSFSDLMDLYKTSRQENIFPASEMSLPLYLYEIVSHRLGLYLGWDLLHNYIAKPYMTRTHPAQSYRTLMRERGALPLQSAAPWVSQEFVIKNFSYLNRPFVIIPSQDFHLKKIFKLAKDHGASVRIFYPPISKSLRSVATEEWTSRVRQHMHHLSSLEDHVEFENTIHWIDDLHFLDGTHLNESAGISYTHTILPFLENCD